jgi:hypothetical protein
VNTQWYRKRQFWAVVVAVVVPFGWLLLLCRLARATPSSDAGIASGREMRPHYSGRHGLGRAADGCRALTATWRRREPIR